MGEITMELVNEKDPSAALVLTHFHVDLYRKVYIDRSVTNALLRSLLGEDYMDLMASLISLRKRCQCFRSVVDRESGYHVLTFIFAGAFVRVNFFGKMSKVYIFLKIVSSLTLVILAVRLNCSQITSTFGLSKQINFLDFLKSFTHAFQLVQNCNTTMGSQSLWWACLNLKWIWARK